MSYLPPRAFWRRIRDRTQPADLAMLKEHPIFVRVMTLMLLLPALAFAAEPTQISVYAPQASYQVEILVRDGVDYAGRADLFAPLGRVESRIKGKKYILTFNGSEAEFRDGKRQVRAAANP